MRKPTMNALVFGFALLLPISASAQSSSADCSSAAVTVPPEMPPCALMGGKFPNEASFSNCKYMVNGYGSTLSGWLQQVDAACRGRGDALVAEAKLRFRCRAAAAAAAAAGSGSEPCTSGVSARSVGYHPPLPSCVTATEPFYDMAKKKNVATPIDTKQNCERDVVKFVGSIQDWYRGVMEEANRRAHRINDDAIRSFNCRARGGYC